MFEITDIAGKMAGIMTCIAFVVYSIVILKSKASPNRATWFIWIVVALLQAISHYAVGARNSMWVAIGFVVGNSIIAVLSLKYGKGGWTRRDKKYLIGSSISVIFWVIFNAPLIALLINIFIGFLGAILTMQKAYTNPDSEDRLTWFLFFMGGIINLFAIEHWWTPEAIYPIYIAVVNTTIAILVLRPKN